MKEGSSIGSLSLVVVLGQRRWFDVFSVLRSSVSFVTLTTFPSPRVESRSHRMKHHYRVVFALASFLGFGMYCLVKNLNLQLVVFNFYMKLSNIFENHLASLENHCKFFENLLVSIENLSNSFQVFIFRSLALA
ncbi:hypothetical protein Tco_0233737 [Tanacetum coccineum]